MTKNGVETDVEKEADHELSAIDDHGELRKEVEDALHVLSYDPVLLLFCRSLFFWLLLNSLCYNSSSPRQEPSPERWPLVDGGVF